MTEFLSSEVAECLFVFHSMTDELQQTVERQRNTLSDTMTNNSASSVNVFSFVEKKLLTTEKKQFVSLRTHWY